MGIFKNIQKSYKELKKVKDVGLENLSKNLKERNEESKKEMNEKNIEFVDDFIERFKNNPNMNTCTNAFNKLVLDEITGNEYEKRNKYHKELVNKMIQDLENGQITYQECLNIILSDGVLK